MQAFPFQAPRSGEPSVELPSSRIPAGPWGWHPSITVESDLLEEIAQDAECRSVLVDWPVVYSIRVPRQSRWTVCPGCGARFRAAGPTGYADERAICDLCLFTGSRQLGMMMALVAITRAFGSTPPHRDEEFSQALSELAAFARFYDQFAFRSGPGRYFRVPEPEN